MDDDEIRRVRKRAAEAVQATWAEMGFPAIGDEEVEAAVDARDSGDLPPRAQSADADAARAFLDSPATVLDLAAALSRRGFAPEAEALVSLTRQRAAGDYLQPSGILVEDGQGDLVAESAIDDPHHYRGPGTGYRVEGSRWEEIQERAVGRGPASPRPRGGRVRSCSSRRNRAQAGDRTEVVRGPGAGTG